MSDQRERSWNRVRTHEMLLSIRAKAAPLRGKASGQDRCLSGFCMLWFLGRRGPPVASYSKVYIQRHSLRGAFDEKASGDFTAFIQNHRYLVILEAIYAVVARYLVAGVLSSAAHHVQLA